MKIIRRVNERNQVTIPPDVLEKLSVEPGDYIEISSENGEVTLKPVRIAGDEWSGDDWKELERLVKEQLRQRQYKEYKSADSAKKHLKRLK